MDPVGAPLASAIASMVALRDPSWRMRSRAASSMVSVGCIWGRGMTGGHSRTGALMAPPPRPLDHELDTELETNWASVPAKAFGWSIGISVRLSGISTNREFGNDAANRRPDWIGITLSSAAQATSTG